MNFALTKKGQELNISVIFRIINVHWSRWLFINSYQRLIKVNSRTFILTNVSYILTLPNLYIRNVLQLPLVRTDANKTLHTSIWSPLNIYHCFCTLGGERSRKRTCTNPPPTLGKLHLKYFPTKKRPFASSKDT